MTVNLTKVKFMILLSKITVPELTSSYPDYKLSPLSDWTANRWLEKGSDYQDDKYS